MAYITPRTSLRSRHSGALGALTLSQARRRGGYSLRGLGAVPAVQGEGGQNAADLRNVRARYGRPCPAWGCGYPAPAPAPTPVAVSNPPNTFYPGTPVPVSTPTSSPFVDANGNLWIYNGNAGGWINSTLGGNYYAGTPVPVNTPTNSTYTDSNGNVWVYSNGNWINTNAPGAALPANAIPQPVAVNVASSSGYQSVLDWLSQQTLITGVPNWVIAAGGGLLALKLSRGR